MFTENKIVDEYVTIGNITLSVTANVTVSHDVDIDSIAVQVDEIVSVQDEGEDVDYTEFTYKGRALSYWIKEVLES